jgi:hypothetical protein
MQAYIYMPSRNVMQAGLANTKKWVLEVINNTYFSQEQLMGWSAQIGANNFKLLFENQADAENFAKNNNIFYSISQPNVLKKIAKQYQFTFTKNRNIYYY